MVELKNWFQNVPFKTCLSKCAFQNVPFKMCPFKTCLSKCAFQNVNFQNVPFKMCLSKCNFQNVPFQNVPFKMCLSKRAFQNVPFKTQLAAWPLRGGGISDAAGARRLRRDVAPRLPRRRGPVTYTRPAPRVCSHRFTPNVFRPRQRGEA